MKRRKRIFRILVTILVILTVIVAAAFTLEKVFDGKIKTLFVKELNKQLVTEVSVRDIRFSIIRDFPYASLRFSGVTLKEAVKDRKPGTLLDAGLISLRFSIMDLLRNRFSVTNLLVKDAAFSMKIFEDGSDNYHFWKSSSSGNGKEFSVDLRKIIIEQSEINYQDRAAGQDFRFLVKDARMSGKFASDNYLMDAKGDVLIRRLETGSTVYLSDREAKVDASLQVDDKKDLYNFTKGELVLNDLHLDITGWLDQDDSPELDLKLKSAEAGLDDIVSVIPAKYQEYWKAYRFSGNGTVDISLKGRYDGVHLPAVNASLSVTGGTVSRKNSGVSLEQLETRATYTAGQDQLNEKFTISGLTARLGDGTISGSLVMNGLTTTDLLASVKADINLADAHELIQFDTVTSLKGRLLLDGKFQGRFADVGNPRMEDLNSCRLSGFAKISGGEIGLKGYKMPVENVESQVSFSNNNFQVRNLGFRAGKSDFMLKGQIDNGFAWLLLKGQKLDVSGEIFSGRTDFDELSESSTGSGDYNFQLPSDINVRKLHVNLKNFTFRKFSASSISADLKMSNRVLTATNILMQSMKGLVSGQGSLNAASREHSLIQCKAKFSRVNVKSLFEEFGNFGNTDLTSENLDGVIDADVVYASMMYPNLDMDLGSVKAHADIRIDNGRLVNYEPMKGLSRFLRVEDLADIRFETLQNQIDIANQIIYIPGMQIRSSAIDLNLMGTHTFSNELNYHFSLALADLISAKFQRKNPSYDKQSEFGPVEDDGRGRTMVYVSMTGTVDEPVFAYDRKAIREKLSTEMKKQKTELKEAFRKEFGGMQGDSLRRGETAKEKAVRKQQEEGKFVIEWDDDKK